MVHELSNGMAEQGAPGTRTPGTEHFLEQSDPDALKVVRRLLNAGHEAYLVGGCVRDLYLGRRPKDFDIATSATPDAIRRLFRNCRIIGRRFKLAHVFFGSKIIETSTFRTAPVIDPDDPYITHDNEWGSIEDDARRRDFTINGLFFDIDNEQIVDFVDGLTDLEAGLIRTIGDPVLRFQEDPVRMIRAVKFAARLGFAFEHATWDALLAVAPDIERCSQARLLEEIYKLLRGGASRRSFELLLESGLLQVMMPEYLELYGDGNRDEGARELIATIGAHLLSAPEPVKSRGRHADDDDDDDDDEPCFSPAQLFWRHLHALDEFTLHTQQIAGNGVLQAVFFAPLLHNPARSRRQPLDRYIDNVMTPACAALGVARRDRELARQILMAHRRMVASPSKRRRVSLAQRQYFHDALVFVGISVESQGGSGGELRRWRELVRAQDVPSDKEGGGKRKRKRRTGRRRRKDDEVAAEGAPDTEPAATRDP